MKTRTNQPVFADGTPDGTLSKVLGVDANGNIVKGEVSGGALYMHHIKVNDTTDDDDIFLTLYSSSDTPITTLEGIYNALNSDVGIQNVFLGTMNSTGSPVFISVHKVQNVIKLSYKTMTGSSYLDAAVGTITDNPIAV